MTQPTPHTKYLKTFVYSVPIILVIIGLINLLVDPYGVYGVINVDGFNSNKPAMQSHLRMAKAYQVRLQKPRAIILGTSRAEFGLDPDHPGFSHRPTYNLNLSGGNIYEILRYFQHVDAVTELEQVVLALDFFQFDINSQNSPDFYEERLATDVKGVTTAKTMPFRDVIDSVLTLDALKHSVHTIVSQAKKPTYLKNGLLDPTATVRGKLIGVIGQRELFIRNEIRYFNTTYDNFALESDDKQRNSFASYRLLLALAYKRGIDLKLVVNPSHARQFETLAQKGLWSSFETWKIGLVEINEEVAELADKTAFPLWDFSGYNFYTTETVPLPGDIVTKMKWYWESSHFTTELGDLVLDKVLDFDTQKRGEKVEFGVALTNKNIMTHLNDIREKREQWRELNPIDVNEIVELIK